MFKTILIPVAPDHLEMFPRQLALAQRLLDPGGRVVVATVIEEVTGFVAEYGVVHPDKDKVRSQARKALAGLLTDHDGVEMAVLSGKPGLELASYAGEIGADLIIPCANRPGSEGYALGSTTSRLVRRAPCSVSIMR